MSEWRCSCKRVKLTSWFNLPGQIDGGQYKGQNNRGCGVCAQSYRHLVSLEQQFRSVFDKGHATKKKSKQRMDINVSLCHKNQPLTQTVGNKNTGQLLHSEKEVKPKAPDQWLCLPTWKSPVMPTLRSHLYVPGFTTATLQRTVLGLKASDYPLTDY